MSVMHISKTKIHYHDTVQDYLGEMNFMFYDLSRTKNSLLCIRTDVMTVSYIFMFRSNTTSPSYEIQFLKHMWGERLSI